MPNRRDFLKLGGTAAVAPMLGGFSPSWSQNSTVLTRYEAATPEGKAMLAKLAKAVDAMVHKPEPDPFNWTSWWYTHGVRDDMSDAKEKEITRIFKNLPPQSSQIAERTWDTCQAHHSGGIEDLFLPWHRYFVYSFERVVRTVISDPTFTLPYWNYLRSTSRAIPPEFRDLADPVLKALFRKDRLDRVNQGSAIDTGFPVSPINLNDLKYDDYSSFCQNLDFQLHGTVHVLVGNGRGMGAVPWAGNDPLFWVHHCNVDRLWASWNKGGGRNPATEGFLNSKFSFVGPDRQLTEFKVGDCLNTHQLDYEYSTLEERPTRRLASSVAAFSSATTPTEVATNVHLGTAATKVLLKRSSSSRGIARFSGAVPPSQFMVLGFRGLQTNLQPGSLYEVFLNLPENLSGAARQRYFAGTINFFEAQNRPDNRKFVLDVSELRGIINTSREPAVTILPANSPAVEAIPVIAEISLSVLR